jgi:transposase
MTTKILALTDALGNLVRFELLPGHRFDTVGVPPLIDGVAFGALIADKAFDANAIIADLDARGAKAVISQHPRRAKPLAIDEEMYKWRHLANRELLRQAQGVQTHRNARMQDRSELRLHDPSGRSRDKLAMNPNRP